jgi:hypothetical protein
MGLSQRAGAFPALAWRHLPRDARDTLFQLAVIGWTLLPAPVAPGALVRRAGGADPAVARAWR